MNGFTKKLVSFKNFLFRSYICICLGLLLMSENTCGTRSLTYNEELYINLYIT